MYRLLVLLLLAPLAASAQGSITLESPNPAAGGVFGTTVVGIQDVNNDGHGDVAIGTRERAGDQISSGRVYLFSGATGDLLRSFASPEPVSSGLFSGTLANAGDANRDGFGDVLVGAIRDYEVGSDFFRDGRAYLFSGATGELLQTFVSPNQESNSLFGTVASVPDATGDGRPDYLIGAGEETVGGIQEAGRAYLFNSATGNLVFTLESFNPERFGDYGSYVAGVPDLTGDGRGDLLVAAHNEAVDTFDNAGRLYVLDGTTGGLVHEILSPAPSQNSGFGAWVTGASDLDGDGLGDILVPQGGSVYVFSGATASLLYTLTSPGTSPGSSTFGRSLAAVPDTDGDEINDLLIPSGTDNTGPVLSSGRAYLFSGATGLLLESYESPNAVQNGFFGSDVAHIPSSPDVIVGASSEDYADLSNPGRAYIFQGKNPLVVNDTRDQRDADIMDGACDVDLATEGEQCTLRAVIEEANARAGRDSVSFDIAGSAPHVIAVVSALPEITEPLALDATTQPGYTVVPLVHLVGSGVENGLVFQNGRSALRGMAIGGFTGSGVVFVGNGQNRIEATYLGLNWDGLSPLPNGTGLTVDGSADNVIGSDVLERRLVVAGNTGAGIDIHGDGATGNRVLGAWVGLSADGRMLVANGDAGIHVSDNATDTQIGSPEASVVVAGAEEQTGIAFEGGAAGSAPDNSVVTNTVIGFTPDGQTPLGDLSFGVAVTTDAPQIGGVQGMCLGGTEAGQGNLVNAEVGLLVAGTRSAGVTVAGNVVGLKADGSRAEPDTAAVGIWLLLAPEATVAGNVVGAQSIGVLITADRATVVSNRIGTDPMGTEARPNEVGLFMPGSYTSEGTSATGNENVIGAEGLGNLISGNIGPGLVIGTDLALGSGGGLRPDVRPVIARLRAGFTDIDRVATAQAGGGVGGNGNIVAFNRIGTDATGTQQLGNDRQETFEDVIGAVFIAEGVGNVVLGNLISGNSAGLQVTQTERGAATNTVIAGNTFGAAAAGSDLIPNQFGGIEVDGAVGTRIEARALVQGGPVVR
ncbi:MAG: integrin alpha, partial [Bacteroidota bacterium]